MFLNENASGKRLAGKQIALPRHLLACVDDTGGKCKYRAPRHGVEHDVFEDDIRFLD